IEKQESRIQKSEVAERWNFASLRKILRRKPDLLDIILGANNYQLTTVSSAQLFASATASAGAAFTSIRASRALRRAVRIWSRLTAIKMTPPITTNSNELSIPW